MHFQQICERADTYMQGMGSALPACKALPDPGYKSTFTLCCLSRTLKIVLWRIVCNLGGMREGSWAHAEAS